MMANYTVGYEINISADGDTVLEAFIKCKAEAVRIYGILNELAGKDLTYSELNALKTGTIDGSRVTGTVAGYIDGSHVSGSITASKVSGALTNATIASGNVTGLEAFVNGKIPASKGDGITEKALSNSGYVKFANGLIVQWGRTESKYQYVDTQTEQSHTFSTRFPSQCFVVLCQTCRDSATGASVDAVAHVVGQSRTGFQYVHELFSSGNTGGENPWFLRYIAIGV